MSGDFEALTIDDYAKQAARTDQRSGKSTLGFSMLGLFGGIGVPSGSKPFGSRHR